MRTRGHSPRAAFTLIELLVVIAILGILMVIGFGVAQGVRKNTQQRLTETALSSLEAMLDEYINETGRVPEIPKAGDEYRTSDFSNFYRYPQAPIADGEYVLSASAFLRQVRGVGAVDDILAGLPEQVVVRRESVYEGGGRFAGSGYNQNDEERALTIVDGWGNEIYYVHPDMRERTGLNLPDELNAPERFGLGLSGRPYFMSVGPDGRAGTRLTDIGQTYLEDNVYSSNPTEVEEP